MFHNIRESHEHAAARDELASPMDLLLRLGGTFRRHRKLCLGVPGAFLALALVYVTLAQREYAATAVMVIDTRKASMEPLANKELQESPVDNPTVESQVEILKSENIALSVIRKMDLFDDAGLNAPSVIGTIVGPVISVLGLSKQPTEFERQRAVVEEFESRLNIKRIGVTFVFEVTFMHPDREMAARIANAIADAYVSEELEARRTVARRAATWFQERLQELGKQALEAENAVADYKRRTNIVDTGGRLMNEQQLSELNSQLGLARAASIEAMAKLERVQEMMKKGVLDTNITDTLHNEVIAKLRNQYGDIQKKAVELGNRVGVSHGAVTRLQEELVELRRLIADELQRIFKSDYQIAAARVESIQSSLNELVSQSQDTNKAQVELKALDSAAQSYRTLYDSFLQNYAESAQRQSSPFSEARVITPATAPLKKARPRVGLTLLGAIVLGGGIGLGLAWLSDRVGGSFRSAADIEANLGLPCVSLVPLFESDPSKARRSELKRICLMLSHRLTLLQKSNGRLSALLRKPSVDRLVTRFASWARGSEPARKANVAARTPITEHTTRFVEAIRAIKVEIDMHAPSRRGRVIGIVSALPDEGKSTIAMGLAGLIAKLGSRAILIDADLRRAALSRRVSGARRVGLVGVLSGKPIDAALQRLELLGCDFLSHVPSELDPGPNEHISSEAMRDLLNELRTRYDYVIVDLPPLLPVADGRAAAQLLDHVIMVVEYARTPIDFAAMGVGMLSRVHQKIIGVVLNKVDESADARLEYDRYRNYYSSLS
jgi:succinoglycan biosynthesis transport protein ExoP